MSALTKWMAVHVPGSIYLHESLPHYDLQHLGGSAPYVRAELAKVCVSSAAAYELTHVDSLVFQVTAEW